MWEGAGRSGHNRIGRGCLYSLSFGSCLRLMRALAVEAHKEWLESPRYLNMEDLREHNKQQMRVAA
jgi:hypothetical protein